MRDDTRPCRTDLPPADDPPEETYDPEQVPGEWAGGERPGEEDRAEGAEADWLYQRRNGYTHLYDPWAPETIKRRQRDSLDWLHRAGPFNPPEPHKPNPPRDAGCDPDHDKT